MTIDGPQDQSEYELQVRLGVLNQLSSSMTELRNRACILLSIATIVMGLYVIPAQRLVAISQEGQAPDPIAGLLRWGALIMVTMYVCIFITATHVLRQDRSPFLDRTGDILSYTEHSTPSQALVAISQPPWELVERHYANVRDKMNRSTWLMLTLLQFEVVGLFVPWLGMILQAVRGS